MKALSTIALASFLLIPVAHAGHHEGKMHKNHSMMASCPLEKTALNGNLGLSADQKKKIDAIYDEATKKHQALRDETQQKVLKVLTPEQATKLKSYRADKIEKHADRMEKKAEYMDKKADRMKERADQMQKKAADMKAGTAPAK
jgi:Spy/CpxP family protein refolding chaperone